MDPQWQGPTPSLQQRVVDEPAGHISVVSTPCGLSNRYRSIKENASLGVLAPGKTVVHTQGNDDKYTHVGSGTSGTHLVNNSARSSLLQIQPTNAITSLHTCDGSHLRYTTTPNPVPEGYKLHAQPEIPLHKYTTSSHLCLQQPRPCLLYTSPSPRDRTRSRMPSSA